MFDVTIIGGGPGGYVAAIRAAQMGGKVALFEAAGLGGTCLNVGCIPTKTLFRSAEVLHWAREASAFGISTGEISLSFPAVMARQVQVVSQLVSGVEQLLKANGVAYYPGKASILAPDTVGVSRADGTIEQILTRNIIIATGSSPAKPPVRGLDSPGVVTSDEVFGWEQLPSSLVIIGGGVIGIELACILNAFGTKVTVVEMMPLILPTVDEEIARRLTPILRRSGINIVTGAKVTEIAAGAEGGLAVSYETSAGAQSAFGERVLVATGRLPNFGGLNPGALGIEHDRRGIKVDKRSRTNVPGIYAIGDVTGQIQLAHVASAQGIAAVEDIFGHGHDLNLEAVPGCVFSLPEAAGVGLTEKACKEAGISYSVSKFPFAALGKAVAMGETEGLVKIIADAQSGKILGVHIMGPHATDLIHEGALAVTMGATATDLVRTIHAHPTLSEAILEAAHGLIDGPIHVHVPRRR